jgi:hypothetical protein
MTSFLGLLLHVLASPFKSQAQLEAEIVFLRHQLCCIDPTSDKAALAVIRLLIEPCAYQKLDPTILMMKRAEDWSRRDLSVRLDRPMARRILVEGQMRSEFVVVAGVGRKDPAQMGLPEDNDVIEAFPADRTDQSLRMPILPG